MYSQHGQVLRDLFFHEFWNLNAPARLYRLSASWDHSLPTYSTGNYGYPESMAVRSQPMPISRSRRWIPKLSLQHPDHSQHGNSADVDLLDDWETVLVPGPDITDKPTLVNLAKMCSDAYVLAPSQPDWLNTSLGFNHSHSFGWKGDGLRGHIFTDTKNETVIVAFKGTSIGMAN